MTDEDKKKIQTIFLEKPYSIETIRQIMKGKYTYREVQQAVQELYK